MSKLSSSSCAILTTFWFLLVSTVAVAFAATPATGEEPIMSNGLAMIVIGGLFIIIGYLLRIHHNAVMARIDKNEEDQIATKANLEERITTSHSEILEAIKAQAANSVTLEGCEDKQELWSKEWAHQAEIQKLRSAADSKEHSILTSSIDKVGTALGDVATNMEKMAKCLAELKNGRTCDDI